MQTRDEVEGLRNCREFFQPLERLCKHRKNVFYRFYKIFLKINSTNEGNFVYWLLDPKRSCCSSERQREGLLLHPTSYILIKPRKQASIWLSLSWWIHKPQNITAHCIYSRVNMYNHSSFSCRIVKFQLRMCTFVFVLQVIVGPLAVVSYTLRGGGEHSTTPGTFFVLWSSNEKWRHIR